MQSSRENYSPLISIAIKKKKNGKGEEKSEM